MKERPQYELSKPIISHQANDVYTTAGSKVIFFQKSAQLSNWGPISWDQFVPPPPCHIRKCLLVCSSISVYRVIGVRDSQLDLSSPPSQSSMYSNV